MIVDMNVKVVVALNQSLKLLPVQVDLKSDLDLDLEKNGKPQKLLILKKIIKKEVIKIFNSNKKHYKALSFQYIILNH